VPKENKLANDVIKKWPEVLSSIDVKVVPIEYIKQVEVYFEGGDTWILDVDPRATADQHAAEDLEATLEELMDEYQDAINGVNFVVDIDKVKRDVQKRTRQFMKKRK
jgi:vacuolar-type H+-ATPase subunit I/STV1